MLEAVSDEALFPVLDSPEDVTDLIDIIFAVEVRYVVGALDFVNVKDVVDFLVIADR